MAGFASGSEPSRNQEGRTLRPAPASLVCSDGRRIRNPCRPCRPSRRPPPSQVPSSPPSPRPSPRRSPAGRRPRPASCKDRGRHHHPDTAKEKPMEGEVIAVGPGARDEAGRLVPLAVKAGDRILFGKWSGTEVKPDGEDLLIMKESDIMGIIEGGPAAKRKAA